MNSTNFFKKITALVCLLAFLNLCGCAGLLGNTPSDGGTVAREPRARVVPPQIPIEPEPTEPLVKEVLTEGQPAPGDGVWFDKESAKRILEARAAHLGLKAKVQVQNEIVRAYADQLNLVYEAIDLQAQANESLRKEIESQRKWSAVKNWLSIFGTVGGFIAGIFLMK